MAQMWEVVGGADKGGILVREGKETASAQTKDRLSTGALIEEIELAGERLNYKLVSGTGPEVGWISIKLPGKDLAVKTDKKPRQPKPTKVGPNDDAPKPLVLLFPGQGSQYVGMLKELKDDPKVKEMLEKSKDILGWDVLDVCLNGPESKLEETKFCQVAMHVANLCAVEKLKKEKPEVVERCSAVAGLSLGEYTALTVAGMITFEDSIRIVRSRAEAMQDAVGDGRKSERRSKVELEVGALAVGIGDAACGGGAR